MIWVYLHALEDQGHNVAAGDQLFYISSESLRQTAEQIKGHNHEVFIRGLVLIRVLVIHLQQEQKENIKIWGMNQNDTKLWLLILHWPWLERGSSGPGWHSAGKLVHSRAGSRSVVLWPLKTGTKIRKRNKFLKTSPFLKYESHPKKKYLQNYFTSNKGNRSLSSSFNSFHFWIRGGMSFSMYSC